MNNDVSSFVHEASEPSHLAAFGLRHESAVPPAAPAESASPPQRALGIPRQARLTAELLGALGNANGTVRPRYRRGVQGLPGA